MNESQPSLGLPTPVQGPRESEEWGLMSHNIRVDGRRTSVRLEPEIWSALLDVAAREGCTVHTLCTLIRARKRTHTSLTAAIRVFVVLYYRAATTEEGHNRAGHGMMTRRSARFRQNQCLSA
jgi:predicted DNA-binding ribbon-helix-helix protein